MNYNYDLDEFKAYLEDKLKNVKMIDNKKMTILLVIAIILEIALPVGMIFTESLIALIAVLIATTIFLIVVSVIWTKNRRENRRNLFQNLPNDVYEAFYHLVFSEELTKKLQFNGLVESQLYSGTYAMYFTANEEDILWDIKEHEETRTRVVGSGKNRRIEHYTVYILNRTLRLWTNKLNDYEPITFRTNSWTKKTFSNKDNQFFSASINFNKKFQVLGTNQLQMTKLFKPKIIDAFERCDSKSYENEPLYLENGMAYSEYHSGDSTKPWGGNINKFQYFSFNKDNFIDRVTDRIFNDFIYFLNSFILFEPFDFYYFNHYHDYQ